MEDTIFTKIINREIPSHEVYEDENTFAFLDIHPINAGHTLVVTKTQKEFIWDLSPDEFRALSETVQKVGQRLKETLGAPYVGVQVIGVDVPHAHVHVIPFTKASELKRDVDMDAEPDHDVLAALAEKLKF